MGLMFTPVVQTCPKSWIFTKNDGNDLSYDDSNFDTKNDGVILKSKDDNGKMQITMVHFCDEVVFFPSVPFIQMHMMIDI
jgi:hypothetical protein